MKRQPVFISGQKLRKFIERNGTPYPIRTYICPQRLAKIGIISEGKEVFAYSMDEAQAIICANEVYKLEEKNQRIYDNYLPKKGIDPDGDDNEQPV